MTNENIFEFTNKICGIESIETDENKFYIIHDDSYYNEVYSKNEVLLFLKELENFVKNN